MKEHDWGLRDQRWAGIASDHVTIDGTRVHLLRAEPATTDVATSPILLVHGLGGAASNWLEVMAGLATTAPVVAVDLPGFAHTRPPTPRAARIQPQVAFLARLLDDLGWDEVELHGNSMGGAVALLFAGTHPRRTRRLVLTSPAFPAAVTAIAASLDGEVLRAFALFVLSRRLGLAALRAMYRRTTPEELFARTEGLVMSPDTHLRSAMREVGIAHAANAMRLEWRSESLSHGTHDLLQLLTSRRAELLRAATAITAPMLVVWGDQDRLVRQPAVDALTTVRGDLARVDLAGVGHVAMLEAPDRWLEAVRAWRTAHDAAPAMA